MKLQPKRIAQIEAQAQKKVQILEGVKVAQKVDALRQTKATEEESLAKFRKESIARVQEEIDSLVVVRDGLQREVQNLETQKAEAQIPLDAAWEQVRQEQSKLASLSELLDEKSSSLDTREKEVERAEQELDVKKGSIQEKEQRAESMLTEAAQSMKMAREESAEIRNQAQATLTRAELKERGIEARERIVQVTLKEIEDQRRELSEREKEYNDNNRALVDRYATLERTIKRTRNNG